MDFRNVTRHFVDPDLDGDPVQIYEPKDDDPITPADEEIPEEFSDTVNEPSGRHTAKCQMYRLQTIKTVQNPLVMVRVKVLNKRVQYWSRR